MGIVDDPKYLDPTNPRDYITAVPPSDDNTVYGIISVHHGVSGTSQSICIEPGKEIEVLEMLGRILLGRDVTII